MAIVRSLFKYLRGRGRVSSDPSLLLVAPKAANVQPKPVADNDWLALWGSELSDEARVALGLGYFCGLRRQEVCRLTPEQVSLSTGKLVPFVRKGGLEDALDYRALLEVYERRLPGLVVDAGLFLRPLERLARERRGEPSLLPWGDVCPTAHARRKHDLPDGALDPQTFNRQLGRWSRAAGLPAGAVTPHRLRHSFVTNLIRAGVALPLVSRLAAHANVTTTMRYLRIGGSELREWLDTLALPEDVLRLSNYQRHG